MTRRAGLVGLALSGCQSFQLPEEQPPPDITLSTGAGRLCAGMQPWVDAEIERVQAHTGLTLARSLFVQLGQDAVDQGCGDAPDENVRLGCTVGVGKDVRVYTRPEALAHELVHALRRQWALRTVAFFEEGWAEAVTGSDTLPSIVEVDPRAIEDDVEAMLGASVDEMRDPQARAIATHVVRFLESSRGTEQVAGFFRAHDDDAEGAAVRLEVVLGASWPTWVTRWSAQAQPVSGRGDPCTGGVLDVPPEGLELASTVDCDAPDTFGIAGDASGAWTRRCIRVPTAGLRDVQVTAAGGRVRIAAVPGTCEPDTPSTARVERAIDPGDAVTTELGACTYTVVFEVVDDVPTTMMLAIAPPP